MSRLLKKVNRQTLDGWTDATPIHDIRNVVLPLMHEWDQTVEDTTTESGLQRLDEMTEKMSLETLEGVWSSWVGLLYQTETHQFGKTVEELYMYTP